MKCPPLALVVATVAVLVLAGCSTVESRIKEKPAAFAALDDQTRQKLRQSIVEIGYSPDLVYIALGAPDEKRRKTTAQGTDETWIYRTYYDEWAGQALSHYRRWVSYDPRTQRYAVYYVPVYADVYRTRADENMRVSFLNDKVSAIEQTRQPGDPALKTAPSTGRGKSV